MAQNVESILQSSVSEGLFRSVSSSDEVSFEAPEHNFGKFLRRQRVLRGISKKEIVRVTKVSEEYYDALEGNRLDELPPKAFVIGFLRVLSRYAGLNSDEVVNHFLAQVAHNAEALEIAEEKKPSSMWRRHFHKFLAVFGIVCLIVLMFAPLLRD